jgi:hypothetical protein
MIGNTHNNKLVQKGVQQMLAKHDWNYFVTANFNTERTDTGVRQTLKRWHAKLDRRLLGGRWQKKIEQRTLFVACCENAATNVHWHMMVKVTEKGQQQFDTTAAALWENEVASGTMDVQRLATKEDELKAASYATKGLWLAKGIESFVLSTEFS